MPTRAERPVELPQHLQDLYDHLVHVLERHLSLVRPTPLTADLIEETLHSFDVLQALVEPLRIPQYDPETPEGRLMGAIARLNQQLPTVALRTLWRVHEYLATSDDDGIRTRERALKIIEELGLEETRVPEARTRTVWPRIFPPLP